MSEEVTNVSNEPDSVDSLDDVINGFDIPSPNTAMEQQSQNSGYQQQVDPSNQAGQTLDPFDESQMNNFVQSNQNQFGQINGQLETLQNQLSQYQYNEQMNSINSDISSAVDIVNKIVGHENKDWIEFQINQKAKESPGFAKLWENRAQYPAQYNKALVAIGNDLKGKSTESLSDPQLVENQRAVNQSQQSMETGETSNTPIGDKLANSKDDAEFSALWDGALNGYM